MECCLVVTILLTSTLKLLNDEHWLVVYMITYHMYFGLSGCRRCKTEPLGLGFIVLYLLIGFYDRISFLPWNTVSENKCYMTA